MWFPHHQVPFLVWLYTVVVLAVILIIKYL